MNQIRPVSDLRNNFAEISRIVHEEGEAIILTKNGHGDMVVMSYEHYEKMLDDYFVLRRQAEKQPAPGTLANTLDRLERLVKRIEERHLP